MAKPERHILICLNSRPPEHPRGSCQAAAESSADEIFQRFAEEFEGRNLYQKALMTKTGCMGPCGMGPIVVVYPEGSWYHGVKLEDVVEIIEGHIIGGRPVERLLVPDNAWD